MRFATSSIAGACLLKTALLSFALAAVGLLLYWLWTPDKPRAELEAKYLEASTDMVALDRWRLHVRDTGPKNAPVVILLHGFGASLHTWDAWAHVLAVDRRVVRFDLPGSGLSWPDPAGDYTDTRALQLLVALMDRLGVARASLVGNSIGGRIAWTFAAAHPARVDKLVLVSPDGFASPGFAYGKPPNVPVVFEAMRYALPRSVLRMNLAPAYANPAALTDAFVTRYHDLMRAPGAREAMLSRMAQTALVDPLPRLRQIRAPTLLIWGERDALIPIANSADYLRAISASRLVVLPGIGHLPQEEAPASVSLLQAFLD